MVEAIRRFLNSKGGQTAGIVVALLCIAFAAYMAHMFMGRSPAAAMANDRMYICTDGKTSFSYSRGPGDPAFPIQHDGMDAYPAEVCWWTADGQASSTPTYVLLNNFIGKPGPTFCPVCHRLVVPHNPTPGSGVRPPPTEDEYKQMHSMQ